MVKNEQSPCCCCTSVGIRFNIIFCFTHGFTRHIESPRWLMIFPLQMTISVSLPSLFSSLHGTPSFHLVLLRPLFLFPRHFPQHCVLHLSSPHAHIPVQSSPCDLFGVCSTLVVPRMCSFLFLPLRVAQHIYSSIRISFTSFRFSGLFVVAHASAHCCMAWSLSVSLASFCRTVLRFISSNLSSLLPSALWSPFPYNLPFYTRPEVWVTLSSSSPIASLRAIGFLVHFVRKRNP